MPLTRRLLIAALTALAALPARAQPAFPDRSLRLVVPFAPGGAQDVIGRVFAQKLGAILGQSVVVENRGGAGGLIGGQEIAKAAPDGYAMLLVTAGQTTIARALKRQMGYDPATDFAPVIHLLDSPVVLLASPAVDVRDARALLAAARAARDPFNYGSTGTGTNTHLLMEELNQREQLRMVHIPYRGAAPAFNDLIAGTIQTMFVSAPSALAADPTKFRVLAVTSGQRYPGLPDVPTMIESGVAGFEASIWTGIAVPARTPAPIIARLNAAFAQALVDPEITARMATLAAVPVGGTPEAFGALLATDQTRWDDVVARAGGIQVD